jgi:hypothetical protein
MKTFPLCVMMGKGWPWVGDITKIGDLPYAPYFGNAPTLEGFEPHIFFLEHASCPSLPLGPLWLLVPFESRK